MIICHASLSFTLRNRVSDDFDNKCIFYPFHFSENHRTQTQFEDSLILKLFGFQFVNSYSSLYYIAFFREVILLHRGFLDCFILLFGHTVRAVITLGGILNFKTSRGG